MLLDTYDNKSVYSKTSTLVVNTALILNTPFIHKTWGRYQYQSHPLAQF